MIFSIQRYLEDHLSRRRLSDPDQYAVRLANLYDRLRLDSSFDEFLGAMARIRTAFFRANTQIDRRDFESNLLTALDRKFDLKKKSPIEEFPGGYGTERKRLRKSPRRISRILDEFRSAVEARAIDVFWKSRQRGDLQHQPERVGQGLLAVFLRGVLSETGLVLREVASGIGYVDIVVLISRTPHLIEMKILRHRFAGVSQIATYMRTEGRQEGWLVVFDARPPDGQGDLPDAISVPEGLVRVVAIAINPRAPSRSRRHR